MASINVGIHPDPAGIRTRRIADSPRGAFSTLNLDVGESHVSIFVSKRDVLDALQAALDAIGADFDVATLAARELYDAQDELDADRVPEAVTA
jgi:hypothetical protein